MAEIDLVIPMVFPQDAEWQRDYTRRFGNDGAAAQGNVRFRSWGTEKLLVGCCRKYMPWVRTIYLLLASESQVQEWMKADGDGGETAGERDTGLPSVRIVFHREFMPEGVLPCFNVLTMEMFLHRIPGLSEYFIYSNDDFFPLSPLEPGDFFRSLSPALPKEGGSILLPCQHHDVKPYPAAPNIFQRFVKNGLDMVAEDFGVKFNGTWLRGGHSMQPMVKSVVEEVCRRHWDRISRSFTAERSGRNFNQYIFAFWQHLSGKYVDHVPRRQYVGADTPTGEIAGIIRDPECGIICLNDHESIKHWELRAEVVRREIAAKLHNDQCTIHNAQYTMDVLIIHYNTPELTAAAIRSLWKHTPGARVTVFDNSDKRAFDNAQCTMHNAQLTVIDNTKGQVVDWKEWLGQFPGKKRSINSYGSAKHCYSVEVCMDRFPDGFVLMDSDVLVKQDVSALVDREKAFVGELWKPTKNRPVARVMPMLCWINTPMLKDRGIRYFNPAKMWELTAKQPDCMYDTGAWLLEAVREAALPFGVFRREDYCLHLGHASWSGRKKMEAGDWLKEHRELWEDAAAGEPLTAGKAATERPSADAPAVVASAAGEPLTAGKAAGSAAGEPLTAGRAAGSAAGEPLTAGKADKLKIYVCSHCDFVMPVKSQVYEVVDARSVKCSRAREGVRQPFWSELWQHQSIVEREDLPEYVGVCHYRRYFDFMDEVPDMDEVFREYDAIAVAPLQLRWSVREQYGRSHNARDIDLVTAVIRRDHPELSATWERCLREPSLYACNMVIMRREDFRWMVGKVLDVLDGYLAAVTPSADATGVVADPIEQRIRNMAGEYHIGRGGTGTLEYQYRIGAFLSERIVNALLRYRFCKIKHYGKVMTERERRPALCP